ncbi:hypothetical protein [Trinickia dinghuensis]
MSYHSKRRKAVAPGVQRDRAAHASPLLLDGTACVRIIRRVCAVRVTSI